MSVDNMAQFYRADDDMVIVVTKRLEESGRYVGGYIRRREGMIQIGFPVWNPPLSDVEEKTELVLVSQARREALERVAAAAQEASHYLEEFLSFQDINSDLADALAALAALTEEAQS